MCFHRISLILLFFSCLAFSASDIKSPSSFGFSLPSTKSARNSIAMEPMAVEGVIDSSYKLGPGDYLDIMQT
jgi:hypothetical protein